MPPSVWNSNYTHASSQQDLLIDHHSTGDAAGDATATKQAVAAVREATHV